MRASKEQLVRLVGLREIFHKVEIFILAVYMTEIARIVFEVVAHEDATLYTDIHTFGAGPGRGCWPPTAHGIVWPTPAGIGFSNTYGRRYPR